MSNMNFNCDVCGREMLGCTFVNGMKFCAKCYQETFGETEKDRKISDLEAKLAEKDKEIEDVTIRHLDMLKYFIRHNSKQGIILTTDLEREIKEIEQGEKIWQTKNFNQDKISFAVEQLEQLRHDIWTNQADDDYTDMQVDLYELNDIIDVRIMQIKEGK